MTSRKIFGICGTIIILSLIVFPSMANAATCGNLPSSISGLIMACIPANVVNTQASATPTNFQMGFNALPFNALAGNVVIYNGISGSLMPAWVESNSLMWVNLQANTIPASSSANGIYYFGVGGSGTNFFLSGNDIGEAPQLSGSYAQYDNGGTVFSYYQAWGGLSGLPAGWTSSATTNAFNPTNTVITATGLATETRTPPAPFTTANIPYATDLYGSLYTTQSQAESFGLVGGGIPGYVFGYFGSGNCAGGSNPIMCLVTDGSQTPFSGLQISPTPNVYTFEATSANSVAGMYNYGTLTSLTGASNLAYTTYGFAFQHSAQIISVYWTRGRAYPPNGIMPSASFGPLQTTVIPILSISPNPSTYGQSVTLTTTCASGDSCAIDYPSLGTHLATGTSTATYTYPAGMLTSGSYSSYYANDITGTLNSMAQTLTVNPVPPPLLTITNNAVVYGTNVLMTATNLYPSAQYLVPITFTNSQATAVATNTPISFVFNALAYQGYEANTLNNTELLFINGTIAPSWLEGNYLNEQEQANMFYTSNSIMYWFKSPKGFLPADSTNTLYLAFAGTSTNLWSMTANIGIAPQLTCSNPASASSCSAGNGVSGIYGQYDDGNNIFSFYDNFTGLNLNVNQWNQSGSVTVNNGVSISGTKSYILSGYSTNAVVSSIEGFGSLNTKSGEDEFGLISDTSNSAFGLTPKNSIILSDGLSLMDLCNSKNGGGNNCQLGDAYTSGQNTIMTIYGNTIGSTYLLNYLNPFGNSNNYNPNPSVEYIGAVVKSAAIYLQNVYSRISPPNNVMPMASFGNANPNILFLGYCIGSGTCSAPTKLSTGIGTQTYNDCSPTCLGLGTFNVVANDVATLSSFNSIIFVSYVPLAISNIISGALTTNQVAYPASPYTWNTYYPALFSTASPSPSISYTLASSPALPNLPTLVANVYYVPPATTATGNYVFTLTEAQGAGSVNIIVAANTLSMNDIASAFTFNLPIIQYFPNAANVPKFNARPTRWGIVSYPAGNNHLNTTGANNIDQWSNITKTFTPNVVLNYCQFSPCINFTANIIDNPLMTNSITQTAWNVVNATSTPAFPITRRIATINGYDASNGLTLAITTQYSSQLIFNNYTISITVQTPTINSINIYAPTSNYINPPMNFTNQVLSSSNTPYYISQINYPFNSKVLNGNWLTFPIYMAPESLSQLYSFTVYECSGFAQGDYMQVKQGATGQLVQQFLISSASAFSIPLIIGQAYSFTFLTSAMQIIYSTSASVWTTPTTLYIPCVSNFTPAILPNIQTSCNSANAPGNQLLVTCTGEDSNNQVYQWEVKFINQSTLLTSTTMNTLFFTGTTFTGNYIYPSNHTQYKEQVIAFFGSISGVSNTWTFISGPLPGFALPYGLALFAICLVLLPVVLAYFHRSALILLEIVVIIIGQALGILTFTIYETGFLIVLCGICIIIDYIR